MCSDLDTALAVVKAAGYRVSKPKTPKEKPRQLNAIGRPYGDNYDPNYRMKYKPRRYAPPQSPEFSRFLTSWT